MFVRCFILLTLFLSFSVSAEDDWIQLAESDTSLWEGRAGTLIFSKTKNGTEIAVASGRIFFKKEKNFDFVKWYVSTKDCYNGYGKMITLDIQGNFKYENDFVEKGGSIASAVAAMLCHSLLEERRVKEGKGI